MKQMPLGHPSDSVLMSDYNVVASTAGNQPDGAQEADGDQDQDQDEEDDETDENEEGAPMLLAQAGQRLNGLGQADIGPNCHCDTPSRLSSRRLKSAAASWSSASSLLMAAISSSPYPEPLPRHRQQQQLQLHQKRPPPRPQSSLNHLDVECGKHQLARSPMAGAQVDGCVRSRRTISQSMSELAAKSAPILTKCDLEPAAGSYEGHRTGPRPNKFQVVWSQLSFSYEAGFFARQKFAYSPTNSNNDRTSPGAQGPNSRVLSNISGSFASNQLVAVIGPSGCGKTTLLQFLAGNNSHQRHRLRIRGLDEPKVAYIGQDDGLLPGLTAEETLVYASRLQNHRHQSAVRCAGTIGVGEEDADERRAPFNHAEHIKPVLDELGLAECARREVTKLSGGQAKRVTIAQELLCPTNLLILDEVTSGLDASTSYSIVKLLKYLVSDESYPMSIVMSIHQPSAKLFAIFDRVYVMSEGSCLYEGSCKIDEINGYLRQFGLECPQYNNIADYLIELACDEQLRPVREQMVQFQAKQSELADDVATGSCNIVARSGANAKTTQATMTKQQTLSDNLIDETHLGEHNISISMAPMALGQLEVPPPPPCDSAVMDNAVYDSVAEADSFSLYDAIERARSKRQRPFWAHFWVHLSRSFLRIRRSYILTYLQLITYILLGLQLATFYGPQIGELSGCPRIPGNLMSYVLSGGGGGYRSTTSDRSTTTTTTTTNNTYDHDDHHDDQYNDNTYNDEQASQLEMRRIQENMNFLLVTVMTATFAALEITVITFPLEAKTIKREWRNGWYRVSSYFLGRTMADLPFQLGFVVTFCLLIYLLTGQPGLASWRFAAFVATIVMVALIAQSFGFIFGAIFMDNLPAAVFTAPLCIFPALLFSGFFARVSQIPQLYMPMTYLSHFRYAFDALLVSLYGYERCACDQTQLTGYHTSLANQQGGKQMREMFHYLFGSSNCPLDSSRLDSSSATAQEDGPRAAIISHEDLGAISASNRSLGEAVREATRSLAHLAASVAEPAAPNQSLASSPSPPPTLQPTLADEEALWASLLELAGSGGGSGGGSNSTTANASTIQHNLTSTTTTLLQTTPTQPEQADDDIVDQLAGRFAQSLSQMLDRQANFGHPLPRDCSRFQSYLMTEFGLANEDLLFGLLMLALIVVLTRILCNLILNHTISSRVR